MEKKSTSFFNSPIIQKNTPIRRLGLSRKRKSSGSDVSSVTKVRAFDKEFSNQSPSEKTPQRNEVEEDLDCLDKKSSPDLSNDTLNDNIDYESEIESLKKRISENEEKLTALQQKKSHITHLEELTELWRNGCKNAFLYLFQLVKEKQSESLSVTTILKSLGIYKTMIEHFENDSDIFY